MDKNKGICVQIGIGSSAEYSFLTRPDWREINNNQETNNTQYYLPIEITNLVSDEPWLYYGIDCDPYSIIGMSLKYPEVDNWLIANITPESLGLRRVDRSWFFMCEQEECSIKPSIAIPCLSLSDALKMLDIEYIDVLAIDIEGDEVPVLESYDFKIKPCFITVEIHVWPPFENWRTRILDCLTSHGYTLVKEIKTNILMEIPTIEAQFKLKCNRKRRSTD